MKKFLLKTWLLLACLLLGVGTSWAEEVVYKTALFGSSYNSKGVSSYAGSFSATNNNFTVDLVNFNNNNNAWDYVKTGNKTNAAVGTITTNAAIDKAITKVVVTIDAITSTSVNSITLYSGSSASDCSTNEGTFSAATGAQTVSISSPSEGKFYMVSFDCKKGSSNGLVQVSKVEYYYNTSDDGGGSTPTVTAPVFDVTAGTYYEDQLVLIDNYDSNYLYAYTLDGSNPAFNADLDVTNGTMYDENEGIVITSSCTLKAIAIDEDGNTSSITSAAYVISYPQVFASLEELVAADLESGAIVKVSFENVPIKSIYTTAQGYRNGIYFDIQKDGKDIEIFYQNVPEAWEEGGVLSGTMTCPWKLYNGTWELAPVKDTWDWTSLTYTARSITALTVSGTPTKKEYYVGDAFDPTGLVVTATYNVGAPAVITEDIEWTFDPETLTLGTTSVDVIASVGSVDSEVYTVTGLTVTENPYQTATISSFEATSGDINSDISYEAFQGNAGTAPAVNNNNLRLYQNGGYVTITALTGLKIASVKITTSATYASTTVGYCVDDNDAPTSGETVAKSSDYTISGLDNKAVSIYCLGTDRNTRLEISAIEVKYSGTVVTELKSIALSGSYPTEFTQDDTFSHEGMIVTATYTDNTTDDVTADATFSGYDMSALGEQTVTVSYTENGITKTADYAITVSKAPFVPTIVPEGYESVDLAALYSSVSTNADVEDYEGTSFALAFAKPESSRTPTKYYDNGKAVRAYTGNTITITAAENIKNVFVDYVSGYYDDAATITGLDTKTAVITFSKTCRFYGITVNYTVNTIDLTAQEDGIYYATFSNNETVYFSNGAKVNTVNVKSGAMTLATVVNNVVPASTGVLLSTTSATASYYRAASHTESLSNNMLRPASETMTGDYLFYKLAYGNWENKTGLGFYYGAADGAAFTAKAGGAYLAVPTGAGARAGYAFNGDEADGLEAIELNEAATIYTLDGTQINELRKGLNIVNGKKIFVK